MSYTASLGVLPVSGNTPLNIYDSDSQFQTDTPKIARWIQISLGHPVIQVELTDTQVYSCVENSVLEYSSLVNTANTKNWLATLMGIPTSSDVTGKYPYPTYSHLRRVMDGAASVAGVGGSYELKSGSVVMHTDQQVYDLNVFASASESQQVIEIQEVFHNPPPAIARTWDPYFGMFSSDISNTFGSEFGAVSAGLPVYYLFPASTTILRAQSVELNDRIRRSNYAWKVINNQLYIYPSPSDYMDGVNLWFSYYVKYNPLSGSNPYDTSVSGVMDISTIPYNDIQYSKINKQGKRWIREYSLALSQRTLGRERSKVTTIPIPGSETTLDGDRLLTDALDRMKELREELLKDLEEVSMEKLMEKEAAINESLQKQSLAFPLGIYVG